MDKDFDEKIDDFIDEIQKRLEYEKHCRYMERVEKHAARFYTEWMPKNHTCTIEMVIQTAEEFVQAIDKRSEEIRNVQNNRNSKV